MADSAARTTLVAVSTEFTGTLALPVVAGTEAYHPGQALHELLSWALAGCRSHHDTTDPAPEASASSAPPATPSPTAGDGRPHDRKVPDHALPAARHHLQPRPPRHR